MSTRKMILMALAIAINVIGAYLGTLLQDTFVPIFLDTIGTFTIAFLFGSRYGMIVGFISPFINWMIFDPFAIWFMPVQLVLGFLGGRFYKWRFLRTTNPIKLIVGIVCTTVPASAVAATIAAYLFGGITASGITIVNQVLKQAGVNLYTAVFSTQILFDLLDKTVTILLALLLVQRLKGIFGQSVGSNKNKSA